MKKQFQRILLEDIVTVQFRRHSEYSFVKILEMQKFHEMPFLKQNFKLEEPEALKAPRGIEQAKKMTSSTNLAA